MHASSSRNHDRGVFLLLALPDDKDGQEKKEASSFSSSSSSSLTSSIGVEGLLLNGGDEFPNVIIRGSDADDIDGSLWEDLESGQPPEWMVMKELLGINVFTYILGGLIVFFLSMNILLGPGWLGSFIGVPGTGSLQEMSDSLPDMVDLSSPEYRL